MYKNAISIRPDTEFPKQAKLWVDQPIDRENQELIDSDGNLIFAIIVTDNAGNQAEEEVILIKKANLNQV